METYARLAGVFRQHLEAYLAEVKKSEPRDLYEPESYILSLGGKRLRPLLALIGCDLFEGDVHKALPAAMAVELFHNFSLVHDDILDAAPLRRGKPTVHHKWDVNRAILSGDVMLVKAIKLLADSDLTANQGRILLRTAVEVCEGQQEDMSFEQRKDVTVDEYLSMIEKKTAVLLGCSLQMGAMAAGAGEQEQHKLYQFGKHLGISFQLLDDLLDVFSNDDKFGKQSGGDILADKKTFLSLRCLELADDKQKERLRKAAAEKQADRKVTLTRDVFSELKVDELCRKLAAKHTATALEHLQNVKAGQEKKATLIRFANELIEREV